MPFVSQDQAKWMYANKPAMAKRWQADTPKGRKLPSKVREKMNKVAEKKFFGSKYSK